MEAEWLAGLYMPSLLIDVISTEISFATWYILIKFYLVIHFNIVWTQICKTFSDLYRLALFGMYILAETLHNFA